jgi:hypothetical protein
MRLEALFLSGVLFAVAAPIARAQTTNGDGTTYIMPDFRPWWSGSSVGDIRFDVGRSNDRLVDCDDWTNVGPAPVGMSVLSFTLSSPNFGAGDLRLRRQSMPDGSIEMYQRIWQVDVDGVCSVVESEVPVAVIPAGSSQAGRWLPLAKFALYNVADDGWIGDRVACQIKRWCCLGSSPTCATRSGCPQLPPVGGGDNLEAGSRDQYPFHWTDQFLPVEGIPSGTYWFEDEINPGGIMWESDYTNNSMFFMIAIDQEARTVQIVQPPDGAFSTCPAT